MTRELKKLDTLELFGLYEKVVAMRKQVLDLVQEYGFNANQLVSQTFEKSIEAEYGKKILNRPWADVEPHDTVKEEGKA